MKKETLIESLKEIDTKLVNEVKKQDLFTDIYEVTDFDLLEENFGDIALYKINEITYEEEEKAPRREAFENVLGALRDSFNNFLYIILGTKEKVSIYFGVAKNSYIDSSNSILELQDVGDMILKPSIEGNFRGSKIKEIISDEKEEVLKVIRNQGNKYAYFEGNPGINESEDRSDFQGIDRLIDIMSVGNQGTFGLVIYANPIQKEEIVEIEKDIYKQYNYYNTVHKRSYQLGENQSNNTGESATVGSGTSESTAKGKSSNETSGSSETKTEGSSASDTKGSNESETKGTNYNKATGNTWSNSEGSNKTENTGKSTTTGTSNGSSTSSKSSSTGESAGTSWGTNKNKSEGGSKTITEGSNLSQAKGTSTSRTSGTSLSKATGTSTSKTSGTSENKTIGTTKNNSTTKNSGSSTGTSETENIEIIKKEIHSWISYIDETLLPIIDYGKGKGLFRVNTYIFADNSATLLKLGNTLKSLSSGKKGNKRPLEYYRLDNVKDKKIINNLVNFQMNKIQNDIEKDEFYTVNSIEIGNGFVNDFYSSKELSLIAGLPRKEVNGLKVTKQVEFGLNTTDEKMKEPLELGNLVQSGKILENSEVNIDKKDLNKHIFVAGVTGTGKTTTCQRILLESGMPFLVVEPAKTEYRIMKLSKKTEDMVIFTLGQDNIAPFRLNPFEFFPHESLTSRVDMIKAAIEASFDMEAAIPQLIESTIYECYKDYGWNVNTNKNTKFENPFADDVYAFPTFNDILKKVDAVAEKQGFDERLKKDYIGSIKARLQSLTLGSKGLMLNTPRSIDFVGLLDKKVVLEIEEVKNTGEKSFVMGLIMTNLREALRAKYKENKHFKHITLIEEAHRLLSKFEPGDSVNKKQGVEIFADMLAEVRKYGESLIIADQIPNKLTPEVLKNTNTKIIHKLFAEDDKESVGNTMILEKEQKEFLSSLPTGRAVVFSQGWSKAVQVQIKLLTNTTSDEEVDEQILKDSCINYYRENYRREIFSESNIFDREPTFEEMKTIIEFSRSDLLSSFKNMYAALENFSIRDIRDRSNIFKKANKEYVKNIRIATENEKNLLAKYLKEKYFVKKKHKLEEINRVEELEKNIIEFLSEEITDEKIDSGDPLEIKKLAMEKLGKGDE
ncbi:helicase HerA domain-containing protein [Leptotrichia sp. oral taxon 498]|uniref:helicase HerA domain-containing protein n=1 Tax=Leptotrichia sp. oral taxon 498 TaxID=712368 RepID=UPI000B8CBAB3|nr:DUF87 domain-containing protein [Leptotrichia sp. oral taxon 498]